MKNNKFNFEQFLVDGERFLSELTFLLQERGVSVESLECDHLCYRVETIKEYNHLKFELGLNGQLVTETMVNGRLISTFKLSTPFCLSHRKIYYLELPAPKVGTIHQTGFEHAEFVIKESFEHFSKVYSHLSFLLSGNRIINPEYSFTIKSGMACKFHYQALSRVIELEEANVTDIIFDFDGTILNSVQNIHAINREVFSIICQREVSLQEAQEKYHAHFEALLSAFNISCPTKIQKTLEVWTEISLKQSYILHAGVFELLSILYNKGYHLHLWTARDERSLYKILSELNLEHFFKTISHSDGLCSKPNPNGLKFDFKSSIKNSTIMIGDSPQDILGAKNIKAIAAAALWDNEASEHLLIASGAELFFKHPSDIVHFLNLENL